MAVTITLKPQDDPGETIRRVAKELKSLDAIDAIEKTRLSAMKFVENERRLRDLALGDIEKLGKLAGGAAEECQARMRALADMTRPIAAEAELLSREVRMAELTFRPKFLDDFEAPSRLLHDLNEQARKAAEELRREKDKAGRFIEKIQDAQRNLKPDEQAALFFAAGSERLPISTIQRLDNETLKITFSCKGATRFVITPVAPIEFEVIRKPENDAPAAPGGGGYL